MRTLPPSGFHLADWEHNFKPCILVLLSQIIRWLPDARSAPWAAQLEGRVMSDTANHISGARLTGSWDTSLQQHIAELNGRFLELLAHSAAAEGVGIGTPIVVDLLPELRQLSRAGLHRLAACPYLLLDAGFALPAHWREVLAGGRPHPPDQGPRPRQANPTHPRPPARRP